MTIYFADRFAAAATISSSTPGSFTCCDRLAPSSQSTSATRTFPWAEKTPPIAKFTIAILHQPTLQDLIVASVKRVKQPKK
jgi:hypothetical protein